MSVDVRVAIVDDDPWVARGRAAAIDATDGLQTVAVLTPAEALTMSAEDWSAPDVVIIDAHEDNEEFDRFVGVGVVQHIRRLVGAERPRIVVITGHVFNDLLRLRMAEAGADFFYAHTDVRTADDLRRVALRLPGDETDVPDGRLAATGSPRINETIGWAERHLGEAAFVDESQKALPVSRRTIITARQRLSGLIEPRAGTGAGRELPSWRRVVEYVDRARGKDPRRPG